MGSYYSGGHNSEEHIHTCNSGGPQNKYRLVAVSNRLLGEGGGLNMFYWIQTFALCFCSGSKFMRL